MPDEFKNAHKINMKYTNKYKCIFTNIIKQISFKFKHE